MIRVLALEQATATKALFAQCDKEDATGDPDDPEELKHALNENRKAGEERLTFPELEEGLTSWSNITA